jgi:hypothetical protein
MTENTKNKIKKILPLAIGTGAFLTFRKGFNKTLSQIKSKGKFTWGLEDYEKPKKILDKIKERLAYGGDIKLVNPADKKIKKIEGAYYHDADAFTGPKPIKSDIGYNVDTKTIRKVFQDKLNFGKIRNYGIVTETRGGNEYLKELGLKRTTKESDLYKALQGSKSNYYIKPRKDFGSMGAGHFTTRTLKTSKTTRKKFLKDPSKYVVQENLKFKPERELRYHAIVNDGDVKVIRPTMSKQYYPASLLNNPREVETGLSNIIRRNKIKGNYIFGGDVAENQYGKIKFIELNDQSGFLHPDTSVASLLGPRHLYKAVTGKDTKGVAGIKALAAGAATNFIIKKRELK